MNNQDNLSPNPAAAQNGPKASIVNDGRLPLPAPSKSQCYFHLNELLSSGRISTEEYDFCSVLPIPDDRMAPQLLVGGLMATYWLDPTEFKSRIGKPVVIQTNSEPRQYIMGRLESINNRTIRLSADNGLFTDLTLGRKEVCHLFEVIAGFYLPVL